MDYSKESKNEGKNPRGGGECTLTFSYIRMLGSFFWGHNFEFHFFGEFSEKLIFFWV